MCYLGRGYAFWRAVAWAWGRCIEIHVDIVVVVMWVRVRVVVYVGVVIYFVLHVPLVIGGVVIVGHIRVWCMCRDVGGGCVCVCVSYM